MMLEQAPDAAQFTDCGHVRLRDYVSGWPAAKAATPEAFGNRKPGQAGLFLKLFCFAFLHPEGVPLMVFALWLSHAFSPVFWLSA